MFQVTSLVELAMEGHWVEHLIEEPSKKKIVETHHVRVNGTLDSTWFRGAITVTGLATPIDAKLGLARRIWMCGR